MSDRVTGRDIILGLIENLQQNQEPLLYSTISPGLYDVYLHPDDYERLEGILSTIADEAKQALDKAIHEMERAAQAPPQPKKRLPFQRDKVTAAQPMGFPKPAGGWAIGFHQNADEDVQPGDLVIESTLALPEKQTPGGGALTRRLRTMRSDGKSTTLTTKFDSQVGSKTAPPPDQKNAPDVSDKTVRREMPDGDALAQFTWKDEAGAQTFLMKKPQIYAGRGGVDDWVDLKIHASSDISRRHFRVRRDEQTGQFFIKDLSSYGTTVNGNRVRPGIEEVKGVKRELDIEDPLPKRATIVLADVLTVEFTCND
jgi:FHA domain